MATQYPLSSGRVLETLGMEVTRPFALWTCVEELLSERIAAWVGRGSPGLPGGVSVLDERPAALERESGGQAPARGVLGPGRGDGASGGPGGGDHQESPLRRAWSFVPAGRSGR